MGTAIGSLDHLKLIGIRQPVVGGWYPPVSNKIFYGKLVLDDGKSNSSTNNALVSRSRARPRLNDPPTDLFFPATHTRAPRKASENLVPMVSNCGMSGRG